MDRRNKIIAFRDIILQNIMSRIMRDYWLLEVPFYSNIGDTLIWQGEIDFLQKVRAKCKGMYSLETFRFPKIKQDDLILFQGGGNFGDLWPRHHDFKMKVVDAYPANEFLFLPQTVYFENPDNMRRCAKKLSGKAVTICARDKVSYQVLKENFDNEILLVPDMAFCIDMGKWHSAIIEPSGKNLLLKREDKELASSDALVKFEEMPGTDISDWVTFRGDNACERNFNRLRRVVNRRPLRNLGVGQFLLGAYMYYIYRPFLVRSGIRQLSAYNEIYTTRLHAGILGLLLGKRIKFFDNTYGKNSHFYETWLADCEDTEFMK